MNYNYKYIIVGAGPAGLQMAYFLQKAGMDYLILEKSDHVGSFFTKHPVHRKLISINKKYNFFEEEEFNWRHDWNSLLSDVPALRFTEYTEELFPHADDMCRYLKDYAAHFKFNILYNKSVEKIGKNDASFQINTSSGEVFGCKVLLMGLGTVAPKTPELEGIEHAVSYADQSLDLDLYRNKRVGILGGGNSAFETADYLSGVAAHVHILTKHPIKMAWDTHFVGDLRAVNNNVLDMYQLKSLHAVLCPRIQKIVKLPDGTVQTHHEYDYPDSNPPGTLKLTRVYDIIINCTGWKWANTAIFDDNIQPATKAKGKFLRLTTSWESVNIPDLYYIGGAMQSIDRKAASGFIHGFRYNIRSLSKILTEKYESVSYPHEVMRPFNWDKFLDMLYHRLSISAGLYQMYGVLADALVIDKDRQGARWYEEMPADYAREILPNDRHVLIFTLEFGFHKHNVSTSLEFMGPSDPNDTPRAAFLHPVIRHYYMGNVSEFHFGDSLLGRWDRPHGEGGAVVSYHFNFQKWVEERIGLNITLPEISDTNQGPYHAWTAEELNQWKEMKMQPGMMTESFAGEPKM
jgi:thioredoxin reductase